MLKSRTSYQNTSSLIKDIRGTVETSEEDVSSAKRKD